MAEVGAPIEHLEGWPEVRAARIGITGFCMGGAVAFKSAAHHTVDLKAVVAFYGGASLAGDSALLARIKAPVTMRRPGKTYESKVYAGAGHGFFCDERGFALESASAQKIVRMPKNESVRAGRPECPRWGLRPQYSVVS